MTALRFPGAMALFGFWVQAGGPAFMPGAEAHWMAGPGASVPLVYATADHRTGAAHAAPTALTAPTSPPGPPASAAPLPIPQSTFAEVVERSRRAWGSQDAGGIVANARQLLLQLPGSESRTSVSRDQALRLVQGVLRRSEEVAVRVVTAREVGPGQGYAELLRQYRVAGTAESRTQRILLAFRRDPQRGTWELVELRVLHGGG